MEQARPRTADDLDAVDERRRIVHEKVDGHEWRRGFIGGSRGSRRRFGRSPASPGTWERRRLSSRVLHRVGDLSSHASAGVVAACAVLAWAVVGWRTSFPTWWETVLYSSSSSITLVMVFAIQHTQSRQQAAVQRKLDEVLRATAAADNALIAVEEAPDEELEALADLNIDDRDRSTPDT